MEAITYCIQIWCPKVVEKEERGQPSPPSWAKSFDLAKKNVFFLFFVESGLKMFYRNFYLPVGCAMV